MKIKKSKIIYIIFLLLAIPVSITITIAVSKNKTKIENEAKVEIAKPIIEFENISENETITENSKKVEYCFKIKNYKDDNNISQIAQKYVLEFSTENEENLEKINYSLFSTNSSYIEEEMISMVDNKSEEFTISANEKEEKYFKLRINEVDPKTSFKDLMFIKLTSKSIEL